MAGSQLARLRAAHRKVAELVLQNSVYLPIFRRLDAALSVEEARLERDAVSYARAVMAMQDAAAIHS